jgi:hypothetical protein
MTKHPAPVVGRSVNDFVVLGHGSSMKEDVAWALTSSFEYYSNKTGYYRTERKGWFTVTFERKSLFKRLSLYVYNW